MQFFSACGSGFFLSQPPSSPLFFSHQRIPRESLESSLPFDHYPPSRFRARDSRSRSSNALSKRPTLRSDLSLCHEPRSTCTTACDRYVHRACKTSGRHPRSRVLVPVFERPRGFERGICERPNGLHPASPLTRRLAVKRPPLLIYRFGRHHSPLPW